MGYFQARYDSRLRIYNHRAFIRLAIGAMSFTNAFSTLIGC